MVLDSRLRMPLDSQLVQSANGDVLVLCDAERRRSAGRGAGGCGDRGGAGAGVRWAAGFACVLDVLGERKILSVMLECGSELNGAFLAAGLVDKVVLFCAETAVR